MVGWQSLTRWTWVYVRFRSCWWTGKPGMLPSMGSQRVGHNWMTEVNWTQIRTWTHMTGTWIQPKFPISQLRSHTWFQHLIKCRFLMSEPCRKKLVRDKVIGRMWIYLDRNIDYRLTVCHLRRRKQPWNMGWLVFMHWVISQANEWENYSNHFREGLRISRNWPTSQFLFLMVGLRTVMVLVGVSFSLLMC